MHPKLIGRLKKPLAWIPLTWSRSLRYFKHAGRWPSLRNPRGINEKINWTILYDHRDKWDWTCDKLLSRERAADLSPGILVPTVLWAGSNLSDLADVRIEGRWILKSNSSSQDIVVGSGQPDIAALERAVREWDVSFQWRVNGERAYRFGRPLLVLEKWITEVAEPPIDYKVFVFHGTARFIHAHSTRFSGHRASVYTRDWAWLPDVRQNHIDPHAEPLPEPPHLAELLRRAEQIGAQFEFIRVDLYDTEEGVWFGETTPYSWSGMRPFLPDSFELELGSYWTLPDLPRRRAARRAVG